MSGRSLKHGHEASRELLSSLTHHCGAATPGYTIELLTKHCATLVRFTERLIQQSRVGGRVRHCRRRIDLRTALSPERALRFRHHPPNLKASQEKDWRAHRNISARPTVETTILLSWLHNDWRWSVQLRPCVTACTQRVLTATSTILVSIASFLASCAPAVCCARSAVLCSVSAGQCFGAFIGSCCPRLAGCDAPTALTVAAWLTLETCLKAFQRLRRHLRPMVPSMLSTTVHHLIGPQHRLKCVSKAGQHR